MKTVTIRNPMQRGSYECTAGIGKWPNLTSFKPAFTPMQMLRLGVFEGWYLNSARNEYPASWFRGAKLSDHGPDVSCNALGVKSRLPLSVWRDNGWITEQDPRGWFEWYCRFYCGRRSEDDAWQIKRWRAFMRHSAQVMKNGRGDFYARQRQRQGLLQWSHDPFPDVRLRPRESVYSKTLRLIKENS